MFAEFFLARSAWRRVFAWAGAVFILAASLAATLVTAWLNGWMGEFYALAQEANAVVVTNASTGSSLEAQEEGLAHLWMLLWRGLYVLVPFAMLSPVVSFVQSHYALIWRLCLIESYLERWGSADPSKEALEGASQRVHEDTQRFARSLEGGILQSLSALLTLVVFAPRRGVVRTKYSVLLSTKCY